MSGQGMKMKFTELISSMRKFGKRSGETLLIIPIYQEYDWLSAHLDVLSGQTSQNFDVIVILNKATDEERTYRIIESKKCRFEIITGKRKEDTGSAGGFFTGQKYALENDYKQMIFVDIDCIPVDPDLVEKLVLNKNKKYVKPTAMITDKGRVIKVMVGGPIPWYTLISADIVRNYGLYYLPLYYGAEDIEYASRIKLKPHIIESRCQHPAPSIQSYKNMDKSLIYMVNGLTVAMDVGMLLIYLVTLFVCLPAYLIFFPPYGRKAFSALMSCLMTHTYGKRASEKLVSGFRSYIKEQIPGDFKHVEYASSISTDKKYYFIPFEVIGGTFRKNISIDHTRSGILAVLVSIFAKKTYYKVDDKKFLLLSDNTNPLLHIVKFFLFAAVLPMFVILIIWFVIPMNILLRPKTERYGLD